MHFVPQKAAFSIKETCIISGIGRTTLYHEIKNRRLEVVKIGRRTLITAAALSNWLNSLSVTGE